MIHITGDCVDLLLYTVYWYQCTQNNNKSIPSPVIHILYVEIKIQIKYFLGLFLIVWMPYAFVSFYAAFGDASTLPSVAAAVPPIVAKTGSCLNPLMYICSNNEFRTAFHNMLPWTKPNIREDLTETPIMLSKLRKSNQSKTTETKEGIVNPSTDTTVNPTPTLHRATERNDRETSSGHNNSYSIGRETVWPQVSFMWLRNVIVWLVATFIYMRKFQLCDLNTLSYDWSQLSFMWLRNVIVYGWP